MLHSNSSPVSIQTQSLAFEWKPGFSHKAMVKNDMILIEFHEATIAVVGKCHKDRTITYISWSCNFILRKNAQFSDKLARRSCLTHGHMVTA